MLVFKRIVSIVFLLLSVNQVYLSAGLPAGLPVKIVLDLVLSACFIFYNVLPLSPRQPTTGLKRLARCRELLLAAAILFLAQTGVACYLIITVAPGHPALATIDIVVGFLLIYVVAVNGLIRSFVSSKQLTLGFRIALFFVWWLPVVNIVFAFVAAGRVGAELSFDAKKYGLNLARKDQQICRTKYPLVMVHGIFFRDWERFNYWGRIPGELTANGATIFYGGHQSALPVVESAEELKQQILAILDATGCGKVNIIAHSKGGIDSRYAISRLGLAPYVASLTTVNTPHHGSDLAGTLLEMTPGKVVTSIGKRYSSIFTKLGDARCDFAGSVNELTAARCEELNRQMPDSPGIRYQSVGSKMASWKSAPFPLNVGYSIIKPIGGDNDGLVATRSMAWGEFFPLVTGSGRQGVSHADMIDLTRKNIPGFDVTEFYVGLVAALRTAGL